MTFKQVIVASMLMFGLIWGASKQEANALTGAELLDQFEREDRFVYISGIVDMASYQESLNGDDERAQCIVDWFYSADHRAMLEVDQLLERYRERHAQPIVLVLINRACPKTD